MLNDWWPVTYICLAVIGTAEFLSSRLAAAFADKQNELVLALQQSNPSRAVKYILQASANATMSSTGRPVFIALLLAVALYSSARITDYPLALPGQSLTLSALGCAAVSLLCGIFLSAKILLAPLYLQPHSLTGLLVTLGVRSGIGAIFTLAAAGFAGFICFHPLGALGWIPATLIVVTLSGWFFFFVIKEVLSLATDSPDVVWFSTLVQRWMRRIFLTLALIGTALFIIEIVRSPAVTIMQQIALVGVLLPITVIVLVIAGAIVAIVAAWTLSAGALSAELVVRKLVEKKLNVGYTLLGIVMFLREFF